MNPLSKNSKRKENRITPFTRLEVHIIYSSEEAPDFEHNQVTFEMTKKFLLKNIPATECDILIENDAVSTVPFRNLKFDPVANIYYSSTNLHTGVSRYYHGDAFENMKPTVSKFQNHGWKCELIEKTET